MAKMKAITDFVEEALHRGWAVEPKTLVATWFGQQKFTKNVIAHIHEHAEDSEAFGEWALGVRIYELEGGDILLVRKDLTESE